jgi:hypothetical protein
MFGAAKRDKPFKDYCLVLQVHPEADAVMIDNAYWHLAKRYNEAAAYDPKAREKLEELNEAYIVLGSAERREAYMIERARMLGEGALPEPPVPEKAPLPLSVMNRQRPREREAPDVDSSRPVRLRASRTIAVGAVLAAGLMTAASMAIASPIVAVAVGGGVLVAGAVLLGAVAAWPVLTAARSRGTRRTKITPLSKSGGKRAKDEHAAGISLRAQTEQLRRLAAKSEPTHVYTPPDGSSKDE